MQEYLLIFVKSRKYIKNATFFTSVGDKIVCITCSNCKTIYHWSLDMGMLFKVNSISGYISSVFSLNSH